MLRALRAESMPGVHQCNIDEREQEERIKEKERKNASNAFARMKDPKGRKKAHTVNRASIGRLSLEQRHESFSHERDAACVPLRVSRECVEEKPETGGA